MSSLRVSRLAPGELGDLAGALAGAKLPIADLAEPGRTFVRFYDDAGLAGFGGIEGDGSDRLLRSLVVVVDRRGAGLGRTMLACLEDEARGLGVQRLHLLTNTAAPFFRTNGYGEADRAAAPPAITASREFTALCPASAIYLMKAL